MDNAVKYSPAGGEVRVDLAQTDDGVRIAISDQGRGIAESDLELIFDMH